MPSAIVACAQSRSLAVHRVPGRREALGLHADDLDVGSQRARRGRDAGDQPAAADRDHQRVDRRLLLEHLERRSCPGRRSPRGRRTDARRSAPRSCASSRPRARASSKVSPSSTTVGAEAARALDLDRRREARHHDRRRDAHALGVVRDRLRMVAGRDREHAVRALVGVSCAILLSAPRSLNDAVNCRFSNFRKTSQPASPDSVRDGRHGVRVTSPAAARRRRGCRRRSAASPSRGVAARLSRRPGRPSACWCRPGSPSARRR